MFFSGVCLTFLFNFIYKIHLIKNVGFKSTLLTVVLQFKLFTWGSLADMFLHSITFLYKKIKNDFSSSPTFGFSVGHNTLHDLNYLRITDETNKRKDLIYFSSQKVRVLPRYLVGTVVLLDPRLEANVQVELVLLVIAGPGNLLEAVGFGVDELSVLGDGLVGVP